MPRGPGSFQELMQWPKSHVQAIASNEEMKQRLIKVMRKGLQMQTAFSGMDAPREAMRQIAQAMRCVLDLRPQIIEWIYPFMWQRRVASDLTWLAQEEDAGQSCAQAINPLLLKLDRLARAMMTILMGFQEWGRKTVSESVGYRLYTMEKTCCVCWSSASLKQNPEPLLISKHVC